MCAYTLAGSLWGGTIDVSSQSTQTLQNGDSLEFLFSSSSYANYAAGMGMSAYPGMINFMFASMPGNVTGQFAAEIESADATVSAVFPGSIGWTSGYAQSSGYSGPISGLMDTLSLSSPLSQALFAGSEAELILTYAGPDITVGVQGRSLRQDLTVSLSGGPLSMGGMVYSAALNNGGATTGGALMGRALTAGPLTGGALTGGTAAAEPESGALLMMAGVGMCVFAAALKRFRPGRRTV